MNDSIRLRVTAVDLETNKVSLTPVYPVVGAPEDFTTTIDLSLFPLGEQYNLTAPNAIGKTWWLTLAKHPIAG